MNTYIKVCRGGETTCWRFEEDIGLYKAMEPKEKKEIKNGKKDL